MNQPFDIDTNKVLTRLGAVNSMPCDMDKTRLNNAITKLKCERGLDNSISLWDSSDVITIPGFFDTKTGALINIKTADFGNMSIDVDYAGSWVKYKGFKGNGSTFRINSNFNPFDGKHTYKFKANDNCFGCYINTNTREVKGLISNTDSLQNGYELRTHTNGVISVNGNTTNFLTVAVDSTGGHATKRFPSNKVGSYKNAAPEPVNGLVTNLITSTISKINKPFRLFCRDIGGAYSLYSLNRVAFFYFGSSNIDIQKIERILIEELLKPVGAALIKRVVFDGNSFFSQQTMPTKVMDLLWTNGIECTSHFNGIFGISIITMITQALLRIDPYQEKYFDKQIFMFWELTNSMKGPSVVVDDVFDNLQIYFDARRACGWILPILCGVCPPFNSAADAGIHPDKRDNDNDLTDSTVINGKIRVGLSTLGIQYASDEGSGNPLHYDSVYKDALGVAGVGELNTTYFLSDGHMTTTGYNYWATNHLYPQAYIELS